MLQILRVSHNRHSFCFISRYFLNCNIKSYKILKNRENVVYTIKPEDVKQTAPVYPDKIEEPDVEIPDLTVESVEEMDPELRTSRIIIDIVNAGDKLDEVLEKYDAYIDEKLLEKFYKRIEAAKIYEDKSVIDGLISIWCYVRSVIEKKMASPAARLIDKLLNIMDSNEDIIEKEKYDMAYDQISFALLGIQQSNIDIFDVAAKIAEGEEIPSDVFQEYVSKEDFISEANNVILEGNKTYDEWNEKLNIINEELDEVEQETKKESKLRYEADKCKEYVDMIKKSLEYIERFIEYANTLE